MWPINSHDAATSLRCSLRNLCCRLRTYRPFLWWRKPTRAAPPEPVEPNSPPNGLGPLHPWRPRNCWGTVQTEHKGNVGYLKGVSSTSCFPSRPYVGRILSETTPLSGLLEHKGRPTSAEDAVQLRSLPAWLLLRQQLATFRITRSTTAAAGRRSHGQPMSRRAAPSGRTEEWKDYAASLRAAVHTNRPFYVQQ